MKLIIQIPCFNEEKVLPITLKTLPREVKGFDVVEWLVVDDGSVDRTAEVAKECGVDYVVKFNKNKGLAKAYIAGLEACLENKADVIVNFDADNQYKIEYLDDILAPILRGKADIVIGARQIDEIKHFSPLKKILQKFGSFVIKSLSNVDVVDAPSGFRAVTKDAALQLNVYNSYTYTLETIIQAGEKNISVVSVPIRTNEDLRKSKLVKNIFSYVLRSMFTIVRMFAVYNPFKFFFTIGSSLFALGIIVGVRYLWLFMLGFGKGHIQSVILASILLGMGFQTMLIAFIADILRVNRKLLEDIQYMTREKFFE